VLGEGAAILILERESDARARGARSYAAIDGYACNSDAHSMMQIDPSGETVVALMRSALASAGVDPSAVGYVSAHGTSTVLNDRIESMAIRKMFGSRADDIHVTALKSMTGHGIGASGSLETAALALSLQRGRLTPTINYETPDPECDVNVVANRPLDARPSHALKMSYGFGGHNACLVLSRTD
jgi:3-oxoacyl-[acyl-carrier-protein] synthase II